MPGAMRRGWPLLLPPLPPLLPPLLLLLLMLGSPGALAARRRPRAAYGTAGTAYGTSYGTLNLDDLELLAQIADAPVDDGKLTCYTCNNGTDNDQCNKYAIDRPCEPGLSMCRTEHVIERLPVPASGAGAAAAAAAFPSRPRSVRITKSCVSAAECSRAAVGCRGVAGDSTYLRVCTSCCDWSYCNELAPADPQTAVLAVSRSGAAAPSRVGAAAAAVAAVLALLLPAAAAVF